jgi:hypothetical protein
MTLKDTILITLATVAFIIGVHQSFYYGIAASYWLFMISLLVVVYIRRQKQKAKESQKVLEKKKPVTSNKQKNKRKN